MWNQSVMKSYPTEYSETNLKRTYTDNAVFTTQECRLLTRATVLVLFCKIYLERSVGELNPYFSLIRVFATGIKIGGFKMLLI